MGAAQRCIPVVATSVPRASLSAAAPGLQAGLGPSCPGVSSFLSCPRSFDGRNSAVFACLQASVPEFCGSRSRAGSCGGGRGSCCFHVTLHLRPRPFFPSGSDAPG